MARKFAPHERLPQHIRAIEGRNLDSAPWLLSPVRQSSVVPAWGDGKGSARGKSRQRTNPSIAPRTVGHRIGEANMALLTVSGVLATQSLVVTLGKVWWLATSSSTCTGEAPPRRGVSCLRRLRSAGRRRSAGHLLRVSALRHRPLRKGWATQVQPGDPIVLHDVGAREANLDPFAIIEGKDDVPDMEVALLDQVLRPLRAVGFEAEDQRPICVIREKLDRILPVQPIHEKPLVLPANCPRAAPVARGVAQVLHSQTTLGNWFDVSDTNGLRAIAEQQLSSEGDVRGCEPRVRLLNWYPQGQLVLEVDVETGFGASPRAPSL